MTDSDKEMEAQMMSEIEERKPLEVPAWKKKLDALIAAQKAEKPAPAATDLSKPQTDVEADVEADRELGRKAIIENIEAASEKALNAEALYTETMASENADKERFRTIYINTIQQNCLGKTLDECEEMLRERHEALFDQRAGIQAILAYRKELLKDATAEERAKRSREDWMYRPSQKRAKEKDDKKATPAKPKKSMRELMKEQLIKKGNLTAEEIERRLDAFEGK